MSTDRNNNDLQSGDWSPNNNLPDTSDVSPKTESASGEISDNNQTDNSFEADNPIKKELTLPESVTIPWTLKQGLNIIDYVFGSGFNLYSSHPSEAYCIEPIENGIKIILKRKEAGNLDIPVFYNGGKKILVHLLVNPDPWSLWEVHEPKLEDCVFGNHDQKRIENEHKNKFAYEDQRLSAIGASCRGRSHAHGGTFRDDDMGYWADKETGRYIFIVADGAGSARFSREGSRRAIEFLLTNLPEYLTVDAWNSDGSDPQPTGSVGKTIANLSYRACELLNNVVKEHNAENPNDQWKLQDFNTTLLVAALKREGDGRVKLVTFSIGDGAIAWFDGEKSKLMCAPDGGEFGGGTRFLTTLDVWKNASKDWDAFYGNRVFCQTFSTEEAKRMKLFLMTDGVSDPWFETNANLVSAEKWRQFSQETLAGDGENQAGLNPEDSINTKADKLLEWLNFKIRGNHDDRTIIVVQFTRKKTPAGLTPQSRKGESNA